MATRNLARNGGKKFQSEITGIKELEAKFRDLVALFETQKSGRSKVLQLRTEISDTLQTAAGFIANEARSNAESNNAPRSVINAIFSFANPAKDKPNRSAALVGINKKRSGLITWFAGKHSKSPRAKVPPGGKVSMSLAAMFEGGTTKMRARPSFGPAVQSQRGRALDYIVSQYKTILEKFND